MEEDSSALKNALIGYGMQNDGDEKICWYGRWPNMSTIELMFR